jgi:hypothetical protein
MIFDSFDWMQGEPELIGVDGYPIYKSDPYYEQHIYLNDALKESLLPDFWWENIPGINYRVTTAEKQDQSNVQDWSTESEAENLIGESYSYNFDASVNDFRKYYTYRAKVRLIVRGYLQEYSYLESINVKIPIENLQVFAYQLESVLAEVQDKFDSQSWIRLSQVRDTIISRKEIFILESVYACYTRTRWLVRDSLTKKDYIQNYKHKLALIGFAESFLEKVTYLPDRELIRLLNLFENEIFLRTIETRNKLISLINKINNPSSEVREALEKSKNSDREEIIPSFYDSPEKRRKWITSLESALQIFEIQAGDVWSNRLLQDLSKLEGKFKQSWQNLILHAGTADKSQPTAKWNKKAKELIAEIGDESFLNSCLIWFPLVAESRIQSPSGYDKPKSLEIVPDYYFYEHYRDKIPLMLHEKNCLLLKGLVWCCSNLEDVRLIPAIGLLAEACYKKIPQIGARSLSVGNACIYALSMMSGAEAVTQLEKLKSKVKYSQANKLIEKAFETAAARQGITKEDLLELSVPDYGLNEQGILKQVFGSFTAQVSIQSSTQVTLQWYKSDGKPQKSLPAEVKNNHSSELKELKRQISEIESLLRVHRDRLENTYLEPRIWAYPQWQVRYANHPLLGYLANRLVWEFSNENHKETGIWYQNQVVNSQGEVIEWINESAIVRLWHPIFANSELISSWRDWLETHRICQPFKQVYREVYLLTEAEENTRIYSNRFAAHILRQHQMSQLMRLKGWEYSLQGGFDGANTPIFHLPQGELQAEFYVEPAGEELSDANIYLYVASDRVCFYNERYTQIPLAEVPALAFSEVMRNVDLFVGVASIGNAPNWSDRGENAQQYNTYWHDYSFGELAMSAQLRREVISRLLPKLKIGDRAKIDDKFLVVEGKKRTYKIHFGSGNILMEPNNTYLCIVPEASSDRETDYFLPFEGDGMLSIILSKAFLLAEDDKIKDSSILSQISNFC